MEIVKVIVIDKNDPDLEYHSVYDAIKVDVKGVRYLIQKRIRNASIWETLIRDIERVMTLEDYRNQRIDQIIE